MKHLTKFITAAIVSLPLLATAGGHASPSVEMAIILSELNHFPSAAHKATLEKVMKKPAITDDEQALAGIIARIAHTAAANDKKHLLAMLDRDDTSASSKIIATAILNMNHVPSAEDLAKLATLK